MELSLTLAIPTFNRSLAAARLAGQIAPWTEASDCPVSAVFYDDGSTDDTYTLLQQYRSDNLKIIRNDTNQGYARTLIRALSECDTEWVMMVADDDAFAVKPGQLQELMTWLQVEDPDFVCTQWLTSDGRLYRGKNTTERITD
jgi:glycosyltransferase involved in cell wall biosynthesis